MVGEKQFYTNPEYQRQNDVIVFVRDAMPGEWRTCANELRDSAEMVWGDYGNLLRCEVADQVEIVDGSPVRNVMTRKVYALSRPYILLAGFALENIMKGYLVSCSPCLITDGKLSKELQTHRLTKLAARITGLVLSDKESEFCRIAESAVPYWGRYPVPLTFNKIVPEVGIDEELRNAFLSLFGRLDEKLYFKIRDGWDSGIGAASGRIYDTKYEPPERL
jgi:hypothetical protein